MLVDEVRITLKAGDGGDGIVHFFTDRWRPHGGPDGGNGGAGGSVYFVAVNDINRLYQFRHRKTYEAENGKNGAPNQSTGHGGKDLILEIPVGSVINFDNGTSVELTQVGQKVMAAKGGRGGIGNHHYRSATNRQPQEFTRGFKTKVKNIFLQLKLIANVGLIGLPNAGKTSLLNELTSANAKVANYAFTTLEPNLGVTRSGLILADIPGLIEGASDGKGLGAKFLKHVERTNLLIHCVAADSADVVADYRTIRKELENYSSKLSVKPEIVVLTKSDLVEDPKTLVKMQKSISAKLTVSVIDQPSLEKLKKLIQP